MTRAEMWEEVAKAKITKVDRDCEKTENKGTEMTKAEITKAVMIDEREDDEDNYIIFYC